ncbi:hypothetical protein RI367_004778 [Sorochytrium milnesiophthora]
MTSAAPQQQQQQQRIRIPSKDDAALHRTIAACGDMFVRFEACAQRAFAAARLSDDYTSLQRDAASAPDARQAAVIKRRADNVLIMAMVRECGYVRTPLKDCIANAACEPEKRRRDEFLQAMDERGHPTRVQISRGVELEQEIADCSRKYQFALSACFVKETKTYDTRRMDNVKVEVVRAGQP